MRTEETHGTDPFEHHAGAYVLGALTERDAADFSAHLQVCPACSRSVAELEHLPALLDRVPAADVLRLTDDWVDHDPSAPVGDLEPPPSLLPDLLTRAGVVSRPRRWRVAAAVAAVALAASVAGAVVVEVVDRTFMPTPQARRPAVSGPATIGPAPTASASTPSTTSATTVTPVVLRPVGAQAVTAAVRLESVAWGTKIELTCKYATTSAQYPPNSAFALTVTDPFGNRQQVATWKAVGSKTLTIPAASSFRTSGISRVDVRLTDGKLLLTARLL